MSEATLVTYPGITFASISQPAHFSELPTVIPALIHKVIAAVGPAIVGPPQVYYSEWETESGKVAVGFPVTDGTPAQVGVDVRTIPAGEGIMFTHEGPYTEMKNGWMTAMAATNATGRAKIDLAWEDYVTDPDSVAPTDLKTDIYVALEK